MVTIKCYGKEEKWYNRQDAINHFTEGMLCSEGSEQTRYCTILSGLYAGLNYVTDGD